MKFCGFILDDHVTHFIIVTLLNFSSSMLASKSSNHYTDNFDWSTAVANRPYPILYHFIFCFGYVLNALWIVYMLHPESSLSSWCAGVKGWRQGALRSTVQYRQFNMKNPLIALIKQLIRRFTSMFWWNAYPWFLLPSPALFKIIVLGLQPVDRLISRTRLFSKRCYVSSPAS